MITLKGVFFGLAIFFTFLTLLFLINYLVLGLMIVKDGEGEVKGGKLIFMFVIASIFWALALS